MRQLLPTPYTPYDFLPGTAAFGAPGTYSASAWPSANRAILVPFSVPVDSDMYAVWALGGNTTGNYDLGFYNENFVRLASKGTTAMAATTLELTFSYRLYATKTYWAALALSSTSGTVFRLATGSVARLTGISVAQMASALPLPDPFVPADPTSDYLPLIALGLR